MYKQRVPRDQKTVLTAVAALAALTVVGLAVVATVASQRTRLGPASEASIVNLRGETICLPAENPAQPPIESCAYGLKVSDTVKYALANLDKKFDQPLRTGDKVTVSGRLAAPEREGVYNTAGTIEVDSIKLQSQ